jgi:hypothetical protein
VTQGTYGGGGGGGQGKGVLARELLRSTTLVRDFRLVEGCVRGDALVRLLISVNLAADRLHAVDIAAQVPTCCRLAALCPFRPAAALAASRPSSLPLLLHCVL